MPPQMQLIPKTITFNSTHMSQAIQLPDSSINREANGVEIHEKLSASSNLSSSRIRHDLELVPKSLLVCTNSRYQIMAQK